MKSSGRRLNRERFIRDTISCSVDVAMKLIHRQEYSHDLTLSFTQDVSFMKRFRHTNILLFMGAVVSPQHLCVVSEFLARLRGWLQKFFATRKQAKSRMHIAIVWYYGKSSHKISLGRVLAQLRLPKAVGFMNQRLDIPKDYFCTQLHQQPDGCNQIEKMSALELLRRIEALEEVHAHLKQAISELTRNRQTQTRPVTEEEARCFNVLQSIDQPLHIADHKGCLVYRNPAWEKAFGYSRAESQGKNLIELMMRPADATITNKIMQLILQGESHGGEFVLRNKKGEKFTVFGSTEPLHDKNGKIIGFIGISTFPKPNPEMSPEPKVGMPIRTASEQPLQSDLAIKLKQKVENQDYKQNQLGIHNILSPTAEWIVNHGISWPWKGNERTAAGCDARSCCHWLYQSDQELEYVHKMASCMAAEVEIPQRVNTNSLSQLSSSFDKLYEIKWEDLRIRECIGKGSYGILYHAVWHGSNVAVKIIPRQEYLHDLTLSFMHEVSFMKRFRHPNILLFMGVVVSPQHLCIVSEFLARGSLFKLLQKSRGRFNLKHHVHMALDIARGMNYLHCCNPPIIHCDLKSSNLFVDKHLTVKIGDFGLCRTKYEAKQGIGMSAWTAPEVLRDEEASEKSDVYSYGVVLWEITTEKIPWDGLTSSQVIKAVGFMNQRLDIPEDVDPRWASIIERCFCMEPDFRPTFQEILDELKNLQKNKDFSLSVVTPVPLAGSVDLGC